MLSAFTETITVPVVNNIASTVVKTQTVVQTLCVTPGAGAVPTLPAPTPNTVTISQTLSGAPSSGASSYGDISYGATPPANSEQVTVTASPGVGPGVTRTQTLPGVTVNEGGPSGTGINGTPRSHISSATLGASVGGAILILTILIVWFLMYVYLPFITYQTFDSLFISQVEDGVSHSSRASPRAGSLLADRFFRPTISEP